MGGTITEKANDINLKSHVSAFLQFYDDNLRRQYELFKVSQSNVYAFIALHLCGCFFFFFGVLNGLRLSFDSFNVFVGVTVLFVIFILGNLLVVIYCRDYFLKKGSTFHNLLNVSFTSTLESMWLFGTNFCICLFLFSTGYNGECNVAGMTVVVRGCNYSGISGQLPMDLVMTLFFAPIIHAVILKGASFLASVACIMMATCSLILTMYMYDLTFSGPVILLFSPMCMLVLYEFHRQGISVFLLTRSQSMLLEEIDRLSAETHAKELRSMIGNVAHDLKTPLSAFISGLDLITTMITDIQDHIDQKVEVVKGLTAISDSVVNMKNINHFMRMSINRCIDYTKASNGMVLVPRMETVNFRECLQLPLSCMKNLQDGKVKIEMLPVPLEIATNVILDPQWFQENVLCLLSNAVKYSAEGVVSISVSLLIATPRGEKPESASFSEVETKKMKSETSHGSINSTSSHNDTANTRVVEAALKDSGMMLRIDVEDNGIGIADATKPHLFTPFKQAQRLAGGTGLGLYALAKRMEAQGGKYGVENRANGKTGCIFWFSFPYRPDLSIERTLARVSLDTPSDNTHSSDSPVSAGTKSGTPTHIAKPGTPRVRPGTPTMTAGASKIDVANIPVLDLAGRLRKSVSSNSPSDSPRSNPEPLNVLLVDDSMSILKMTGKMLTRLGHTVTTAENGAVALKIMSSTFVCEEGSTLLPKFDVVLMDLQMPIMDGLEATKRLRALEKEVEDNCGEAVHLMIVGVSANSDHMTIDAAFEAGVDDFIPKPFNMKSFEEITRKLMWKKLASVSGDTARN